MSEKTFSPAERTAAIGHSRADLYDFSRWMFLQRKGYKWQRAKHHRIVCDALMRVYRGETKRLIINIPPRYSKTELAVVNFCAWAFGKVPDAEFIHTSYSGPLAVNNSGSIRDLIKHEAYAEIFPDVQLVTDAQSHWKTSKGGVMYAVGAGGTITGFGAGKHREGFGGAIIIDDPHKADEARSDVIRQSVIDWFQNTLESRKNSPDTPIILIMQRLHEKDLSGFLLSGGNGEKWEHVCLSVWGDDGEPIWPEKHDAKTLETMELSAPYMFSGQYRQMPAPPDGGIFKPGKIEIIPAEPIGVKWVRGWDFGGTVNGDYSAGGKLGLMPDGRVVIGNVERFRYGPDERDAEIKKISIRDGKRVKISIPQDPGQAGKTQVLAITKMLHGYTVHSSPESGDKVTRADPLASQVNVGNVLMVRGTWNDDLIEEMKMFPNGAFDDQVDCLSRAYAALISVPEAGAATSKVNGL